MVPNSTESKLIKIIGLVAGVLLLADLAILNFKIFVLPKSPVSPLVVLPSPTPVPTVYPEATEGPTVFQPAISPTGLPTAKLTPLVVSGSTVKEVYIPLGNGSTKSIEWVAISGAEVVLDTANFPKIKSLILEAFLQIPTGNGRVYAKLYNVIDQHDVWSSEVVAEGGNTQRVESKNIRLDTGRKVYRVMMKTTMGYEAILESARLKIILE